MGKFDGVLLASDFDNTLIYTEDALRTGRPIPPLSKGNRAALEFFMAQGGHFAMATGRALPAFEKLAPMIPINTPCVICNGAAIYDFSKDEYLETALLSEKSRERGQQVLDAFPHVGVEAYHVENVIHAVQVNGFIRAHEHLTGVRVEEKASLPDVPLPLGKLLFEAEHEDLVQVEQFIRGHGWASDYELIYSGKTLLELTARGASKGGMLRKLAGRLGVAPEDIYAVGDEGNDLSMLEVAAVGFAPANCAPAVRNSGARIVCDAHADALAEVVAALEKRYF
jgi:Cof subfamily protein (haloacid dehalogenase superfamily)